ncbi:pimeloyl-ACP methyl ester esterase BioH [Candidatus Palibaumannia cicadellinicola]|uniref:Pimeloyl-[acyl-carrier protein] methyl ester esterase n=1 Tax=Candidatus Palibaumannia cicadellinicola TaxID=186490 RepID=A0A088MYH3_9GAMM|nr:pimeloyl-ACP methyl ester esterase BioH [Candidatus Baumannia cicadellinicola]AIN47405.1 Biotin synthesis protein BioH [Candidatus Baumannia cicadellinicola]
MKNLVLLHGWGLNAKVWSCISSQLADHFNLYIIDLPGYGKNDCYTSLTLIQIAEIIVNQIPTKTLLLGWSLGGLVATQLAYLWPEKILGLIIVASSPCFCATEEWPGISHKTLSNFYHQLNTNFIKAINDFISLQTINTHSAYRDACWLKQIIFSQQKLSVNILNIGLKLLFSSDLRHILSKLDLPLLRMYGKLDMLVPVHTVPLIDKICLSNYRSIIFEKAAHVPFLSHTELFCNELLLFNKLLN